MTSFNRIVPFTLSVAAVLMISACTEQNGQTTSKVEQASQNKTAPPAKPAAPPTPAPTVASEKPSAAPATTPPVVPPPTADTNKNLAADHAGHDHASNDQHVPTPTIAPPPNLAPNTIQIVKAEPPEIDMGEIPTNDTGKSTLKLVNTGDKPATIVSSRASCGCTTLKLVPGTVLPAGESLTIDVQMTGGNREMEIHGKTVTIVVEGQPELIVPIKGKAVSFVSMDPPNFDPSAASEGKLKLKAKDGKPFRIMSMQPPLITEFPKEPQAEYELSLPWDKYREIGIDRQCMIYLDHPKCQQVFVQVNWSPEDLAKVARERQQQMVNDKNAFPQKDSPAAVIAPTPPPAPVDADTLLADMIREKKNDEVIAKLAQGLDPNHRDSTGLTVLGMAAKYGNVELIQQLLATKKADLEGGDNIGRTPLMQAASSKNHEAVRTLLDAGANPTTRDNLGTAAISWAAWLGDAATVRELLDAGGDVEVVGSITGWTPLILASGFGDPAAIEMLVKAHANLEAADFLQGATPMIHAARTGKVESINALVKVGANLETPDKNGNTPLLAAAGNSGGDADKIKALIAAGVNIHAKDNRGNNALDLAKKRTDMRADDVIKLLEPLLGAESAAAANKETKPADAKPADKPKATHTPGDGHGH